MTQRLELLIVPRDFLTASQEAIVLDALGTTLPNGRPRAFDIGSSRIVLVAHAGALDSSEREIIEGLWPEPPGLRLSIRENDTLTHWMLEVDHLGLRPVFSARNANDHILVSTRPEILAALIHAPISLRSLAEHLVLGFNLNDQSPFERVKRLRPGERIVGEFSGTASIARANADHAWNTSSSDRSAWRSRVEPVIVDAFERGAALELSGGVDSRLVLSIGLNAGARPRLAFTVGQMDDEEPQLAAAICRRIGIEHRVMPIETEPDVTIENGRRFAAGAAYSVNTCSNAWLPDIFNRLAPDRTIQIGGGGGECSAGFYYTPLDRLCSYPPVDLWWVNTRLQRSGVDLRAIFGELEGTQLTNAVMTGAFESLHEKSGTWRQRTDEFYLTQRVPNAGGPVLSASSCWYQPIQPLLHRAHIAWGRTLPTSLRADRRAQLSMMEVLAPTLAELPFSGGRRAPSQELGLAAQTARMTRTAASKIARRLQHRRKSPDLGAVVAAEVLIADESTTRALDALAVRLGSPTVHRAINHLMQNPSLFAWELGGLLTAAWAHEAATSLEQQLDLSRTKGMTRCAA